MTTRLGVIMDPIGSINTKKDSTYAMLLEAQHREWHIQYMEMQDLRLSDGRAFATMRELSLYRDSKKWFEFGTRSQAPLDELDVILMRKDPPFNMEYVYATYMLERAEARGVLVVNRPQALRDANEKLFTAWFPQCTPPTLVTRRYDDIRGFLSEHQDIILKPLGGMGGESIFRLTTADPNISVVLETLTHQQQVYIMAQRFIPEISTGDKRVLVVDGVPVPHALARIPAPGETRGNLAAGGQGVGRELSDRDRWICAQVAPTLKHKGILFAGLDIIGDYLTEINVTSPTCIRELDALYDINISAMLMDAIQTRLGDREPGR